MLRSAATPPKVHPPCNTNNPNRRQPDRKVRPPHPAPQTHPAIHPKATTVYACLRPSAPVSVFGWKGVSPFQAYALRPVTESNCVLATGGGKQLEVNDQSVTFVNSIRPGRLASLLGNGEAQTCLGSLSR